MFVNTMSINLSVSIYVYWGPRPSVVSIIRYYYYESRHLQHTSAWQPLSFCTWSSEPHRRFAPRVHEAAATMTSYVTVHTCTMRVEQCARCGRNPHLVSLRPRARLGATVCGSVWQAALGQNFRSAKHSAGPLRIENAAIFFRLRSRRPRPRGYG